MTAAEPISPTAPPRAASRAATWLAVTAFALIFVSWFLNAPAGLLGKSDAVAYAVCHRIESRSFHIGDIQMSLCARCTGTFLGAVLGIAWMVAWGRGRAGAMPPARVLLVQVLFIAAMAFDGVNSYLTLIPRLPHLYTPQNWLRLTTGMLNGLAVAGLVFPVFNQTLWRHWDRRPAIRSLRELGGMALAAAVLIGLVLTENPVILYPLALISTAGVVMLLALNNSVIFMALTRTDSQASRARDALVPVAAGLTTAFALILFIDIARFALTGTWGGFVIPGA